MRRTSLALLAAGALALCAAGASAQTYHVLEGSLVDATSGASEPLGGAFSFDPSSTGEIPPVTFFLVDDFAFEAGALHLATTPPVSFEGLVPIPIEIDVDEVRLEGDVVSLVRLRAGGGDPVADGDEVTFRFLELRADAADGGEAIGRLGDGVHPRRLRLAGRLVEVLPRYEIVRGTFGRRCVIWTGAPLTGFPSRDPGTYIPVGRRSGTLGGDAQGYAPPEVRERLIALEGNAIATELANELATDLDLGPPVFGPAICHLAHIYPDAERVLGTFSLVASAARQVGIDVVPWSDRNYIRPGSRLPIPVAVLGSDDLDVRDVDERSLRLGRNEAEPWHRFSWRRDVNRDGEPDLVAWFRASDVGVAAGATELCLSGETTDGAAIEGCDAIDTEPRRPGPRARRGG